MSAAEIARAKRLIAEMRLPDDEVRTRRFLADPRGRRIDPRRTFRRSLRGGGAAIDLAYRSPRDAPCAAGGARATSPARWRTTRASSCISCMRSPRSAGASTPSSSARG